MRKWHDRWERMIWIGERPLELVLSGSPNPRYAITHDMRPAWRIAGVFEALYESEGKRAGDIVDALRRGVTTMHERIDECRRAIPAPDKYDWGTVDEALRWLEDYLSDCERYPDCIIERLA